MITYKIERTDVGNSSFEKTDTKPDKTIYLRLETKAQELQIDLVRIDSGNWSQNSYSFDNQGNLKKATHSAVARGSTEFERVGLPRMLRDDKSRLSLMLSGDGNIPMDIDYHPTIKGILGN